MFTGIIQSVGHIAQVQPKGEDTRLYISTGKLDLSDVQLGDSIAVNGVCLTAVELPGDGFWADVSGETLQKTTLSTLQQGSPANLEKAMTPTTRLGGHLVSGHVDGVGEVVLREAAGRSEHFQIKAPDNLAHYIAKKGSICVDGISLTVNDVNGSVFDLNIVPHTLQETTMDNFKVGQSVNLEVDIIARYLERLLTGNSPENTREMANSGLISNMITEEFLAKHGFIK